MLPVSFFPKKTLTEIVTDLDDNVIVFFDDFCAKMMKNLGKRTEIKIPLFMENRQIC